MSEIKTTNTGEMRLDKDIIEKLNIILSIMHKFERGVILKESPLMNESLNETIAYVNKMQEKYSDNDEVLEEIRVLNESMSIFQGYFEHIKEVKTEFDVQKLGEELQGVLDCMNNDLRHFYHFAIREIFAEKLFVNNQIGLN